MTDPTPLSPAAQAVLDVSLAHSGPAFEPVVRRMTAAALRAAADQIVPYRHAHEHETIREWRRIQEVRERFLAIAAELEAA